MRLRREGSLGYFEIMLEKILHEVETVAEGHCGLVDRMDRLDAKLDRRANELDDKISCVAEELKETRKELKETRVDLSARFPIPHSQFPFTILHLSCAAIGRG